MNNMIYKPKNLANEYASLALNIYDSCSHACSYPCYNYLRRGQKYYENVGVLKKFDLTKLREESRFYSGQKVFLSFLSDCYQPINKKLKYTRAVLKIFLEAGVIPVILTKGEITDWDVIKEFEEIHVGTTITTLTKFRDWEPYCLSPLDRLELLKTAFTNGCHVWVSFEPIINVDDCLIFVDQSIGLKPFYWFGKWNYNEKARNIDWIEAVKKIKAKMKEYNYTKYQLKSSLNMI